MYSTRCVIRTEKILCINKWLKSSVYWKCYFIFAHTRNLFTFVTIKNKTRKCWIPLICWKNDSNRARYHIKLYDTTDVYFNNEKEMGRRLLLLQYKPYNIYRISTSLFGAICWIIFYFSALNKSIPTCIVMLLFFFLSLIDKLVSVKTQVMGDLQF